MIKLQDFAKQMNVTDRAIQKHLKNYADEFEGLYKRKGPNGTWLSDEACELLRSKMRILPTTVADAQVYRELEEAKKKIELLQEEKAQISVLNSALSEWKATNALKLANADQTKRLLDSTKAELDQERIDRAKEQAVHEIELQKAAEDLKKEQDAHTADNKAKDAALQEEEERRKAVEAELEAIKSMKLWQRVFGWGKKV